MQISKVRWVMCTLTPRLAKLGRFTANHGRNKIVLIETIYSFWVQEILITKLSHKQDVLAATGLLLLFNGVKEVVL